MKRVKQGIIFLIVLILFICFIPNLYASAKSLDYDIKPIGPYAKNGYFNFSTSAHSKYQLPIKIINKSDRPIELEINKLNALTSIYGDIQYVPFIKGKNTFLNDENYALKEKLSGPDEISLKAHEIKTINFEVRTNDLRGTQLGGLSFKSKDDIKKITSVA